MSASIPAVQSQAPSTASGTYLFVPIVLFFVLLIVAVLRSPHLITSTGIAGAIIVAAPLVLATYAVMASAIAGRATVDLSVGPLIGFINVTLVQLFGASVISSPIEFFLYAIVVGIAYQQIIGLIIVFVRVQPIIVSLSGYLALSGINLVIMARPGGTTPDWMATWGQGTSIISPVSVILLLSTVGWLLFSRTAFYGHLRLMGSDERAAYTSGVRINLVRLGAHAISGIYAGLAALTYTSLISSGDPTQGTTYTLIAVTAVVLGGTSLSGGRGGVMGSLLGAVNIYLITAVLATFNFGAVQSFVTDLSYGVVLVTSLLLMLVLPHIRSLVGNLSPLLFFVICSLIALGVMIHATYDYSKPPSLAVASTGAATLHGPAKAQTASNAATEEIQGASPSLAAPAVPTASAASFATQAAASTSTPTASTASTAHLASGPSAPASTSAVGSASATSAINSAVLSTAVKPTQLPTIAASAISHAPVRAEQGQDTSPMGSESFIFEDQGESLKLDTPSVLARPLAYIAVSTLLLVLVLRVTVAQSDRQTLAPIVHLIMAALVLLGIWVVAKPAVTAHANSMVPVRTSR